MIEIYSAKKSVQMVGLYVSVQKKLNFREHLIHKIKKNSCRSWLPFISFKIQVRGHPFKTSANFHDFWPLPPPIGSFLQLSIGKFGKFLNPPSPS